MPNWCDNHIFFYGYSDDVERLYSKIKTTSTIKDMVRQEITPGFDDQDWLGTLALVMGFNVCGYKLISNSIIKTENEKDTDYPCRGQITSDISIEFDGDGGHLDFYYESAWAPCDELMIAIAEKFNLDISQMSEEPGCGLYKILNSNDEGGFFDDYDYVVDSTETGIRYVSTEGEACKLLREAYDEHAYCRNGIYDLIKIIQEKHKDDWCTFNTILREYVELNKKEVDPFFGDI